MALLEAALRWWLWADEGVGVALGVATVLCLVRQKLWAWPLGVAYVLVALPQLWEARLMASFALHLVGFLPLNLYGWWHWLFGGERRDDLPVTRCRAATLALLGALCLAATAGLGALGAGMDSAFPYWDALVLTASLAAMWLTARKQIENWLLWFGVNVVSVPLYFAQGLPLYSALYVVYVGMAVWGYAAWRRSLRGGSSHA